MSNIHDNYSKLTTEEQSAVDAAFSAAVAKLSDYQLNWLDPAERLVEAIATYLVESRPSQHKKTA